MELFEQLRREHEFGVGTIKGVARKFGVHRRLVRQALASALPPERNYRPRAKPVLGPVATFIDTIITADATAPRKQRHTARRIHRRILAELPGQTVAESTVRNHVRARRRVLGLAACQTFVPQSYPWGAEAQVDWYEAWAELGGERVKLQVFCLRSMASGAAFHRAYPRATQQAFLEAHERAFAYFGGVHRVLRYDNLASAVRKVSCAFAGPIETATISVATPFSLRRMASSTAISSKGFIDIFTFVSSTPEPSGLTRILTL